MTARVADFVVRRRPFGPKVVVRVDLHGISSFGPGDARTLIRWEWIEDIAVDGGVVVRSSHDRVELPPGAFGLDAETLAQRLESARSIVHRTDVIAELNAP
jgi:hypothetical protein